MLLTVALVPQQLLAEVIVDGRVGAAARRPGERERAHAMPLAPHEQLGAGRHEGGLTTTHGEHVARRKRLTE